MDLSPILVVAALFALIIIGVLTGLWIALALGVVGLIGIILLAGAGPAISAVMEGTINSYTMAAVPLYIFMGAIIVETGLGYRLFTGLSRVLAIVPGGLVQANIAFCGMFAAVCGTSTATVAAVTTVAYDEEKARGYSESLIVGSLVGGGTLGPMIPPSITMILYGVFCSVSIGQLFIATAIPGIIMALIFMSYIGVRFLLNPSLGPKREAISLRIFRNAALCLVDVWPVLLLVGIIFGGIYGGFMTPTEAAAVTSVVAIFLAAAFRKLSFAGIKVAVLASLRITAMAFFILISANLLGITLSLLRIPTYICNMIATMGLSPLAIWGLLILMYLILGCFMCVISMMFVTLPVVFPVMMALGFDPIWLGVALGMTLECGLLTPPVGINLFVVQGVSKLPFIEVVKGSFPFFLLMLCNIALVTFLPQLATWLPSTMG